MMDNIYEHEWPKNKMEYIIYDNGLLCFHI